MPLDKAIEHKKEHRKPYYGSKSFDWSCRNHGTCPWCEDNRKYSHMKQIPTAEIDVLLKHPNRLYKLFNRARLIK